MEGIAKLVMSALVLLMSVDMCAQKINTKEFDKYIRKYDSLEKYLATHSTDSTLSFWDTASKRIFHLRICMLMLPKRGWMKLSSSIKMPQMILIDIRTCFRCQILLWSWG